MKKSLLAFILFASFVFGNDYEFNFDELETIETKPYEYNGYLKGEYKYQSLNDSSPLYPSKNKNSQDSYLGEFFLNYKYFLDDFTFYADIMTNYKNIDNNEESKINLNQTFVNYKYNSNHQVYIGKKTAKWGKSYYSNPVGFIDIKKDPNDPEANREGFTQINYKYNKVFNSDLKNLSFDLVYLRTSEDFNEYLYNSDSNIIALKAYILYKDIDIDLMYAYSNKDANKMGLDFSTNIETNFEIHGELASHDDGYYSYLLGLKYLTQNDLTILSEYIYQNETLDKNTALWDKKYFINSFTQKEPFDILYFNVYYKNILNLNDDSCQNKIGFVYSKIKNLDLDLSFNKNIGKNGSEYGNKLIHSTVWLSLKYSF